MQARLARLGAEQVALDADMVAQVDQPLEGVVVVGRVAQVVGAEEQLQAHAVAGDVRERRLAHDAPADHAAGRAHARRRLGGRPIVGRRDARPPSRRRRPARRRACASARSGAGRGRGRPRAIAPAWPAAAAPGRQTPGRGTRSGRDPAAPSGRRSSGSCSYPAARTPGAAAGARRPPQLRGRLTRFSGW